MNDQQNQQIHIQDSQEPSEEGKQLVSLFNDMENKQLDFLDASGKSIIERIAAFLLVLFGITAFGSTFPPPYLKGNLPAKVLVIITLLFYIAAIGAGFWPFHPRYTCHSTTTLTTLRLKL